MGLKEAMSALAAKSVDQLTYTDVADTYIYYTRLDFDPVGIKFCANEDEVSKCKINAKAKAKLTYCQQLAMARGGHLGVYMPAERLLCENAEPVFGYRELDQEKDTKRHMKYLRNEELAWQAPQEKAKLPQGSCCGIYTAPLSIFDESEVDPDLVFFMLLPYQAYHVLNDYMSATKRSSLTFNHTPNSAVCSASVWAFNHNTANLTTMCAGSKTSGKSDMSMMNLFVPGTQIKASVAQFLKRISDMGGPSVLGKGGQPWPGLDVCKGCPLFKYEPV
jgi:uncharacterized protein (DUF169 family)